MFVGVCFVFIYDHQNGLFFFVLLLHTIYTYCKYLLFRFFSFCTGTCGCLSVPYYHTDMFSLRLRAHTKQQRNCISKFKTVELFILEFFCCFRTIGKLWNVIAYSAVKLWPLFKFIFWLAFVRECQIYRTFIYLSCNVVNLHRISACGMIGF